MIEQYDDHCWLFFKGQIWHILAKRGNLINVVGKDGYHAIDLSQFRFDDYCRDAYIKLMRIAS